MKQIIPFEKEITFKSTIGEITGISLENDLALHGEDTIKGNFYIKGTYKMLKTSEIEENYNYKIPCEINISEEYDAFNATIDIDDFNYEVKQNNILKIEIQVVVDNLQKKEIIIEEPKIDHEISEDLREEPKEESIPIKEIIPGEPSSDTIKEEQEQTRQNINMFNNIEQLDMTDQIPTNKKVTLENVEDNGKINITTKTNNILDITTEETYLTYSVYLMREEDTIESIMKKYKVSYDDLQDYNNLESIMPNTKLIIPNLK